MKGDFTRCTFKRENHFHDVRMQQGRVQLDADWNEQVDITAHRVETETVDVVGHCGASMHHGGFHIVSKVDDLTDEEQKRPENQNPTALEPKGDLYISGGHYYVDGILCENEHIIPYTKQPDLPVLKPVTKKGTYLAYLHVWHRHITALEAPHIREVALGGPDTTTRTMTVWQVKLFHLKGGVKSINCLSALPDWKNEIAPGTGRLAAQAETSAKSTDPCILSPDAGYRRLENQLYRVEVHTAGTRGKATFKWSRDNGSIVTTWEKKDADKLTVSSIGRDQVSNFASGQWIELTDDTRELLGKPGTLVKLVKVEGNVLTIDPATATGPVDLASFPANPKVRRWDLKKEGELKPTNENWIDLEDGVQVKFSTGTYKTGDYWLIPARTAAGSDKAGIEWPVDEITTKPELQLPHGIHHHCCKLAVMEFDGNVWKTIEDCRHIFPPITELTSLLYVSGDGQEAMPHESLLPAPLQVGVANGQWPVYKAKIKFTCAPHNGTLIAGSSEVVRSSPTELDVLTDDNGVAECKWKLDPNIDYPSQHLEASLRDANDDPVHLPIRFTANLSIAQKVAYDPSQCSILDKAKADTVQKAIDELCKNVGADENCHKFLDELRADGIVRGDNGELGFHVTKKEALQVQHTGGIAYVGGCRYELKAGTIDVGKSTSGQKLLIDKAGKIRLITKESLPERYALLAIIHTYQEDIKRIVDARLDLTHLDEKLKSNTKRIATAHTDRRQFVPLLAQTLPDLQYRDGRNYSFELGKEKCGLVFDGKAIWVANLEGTAVYRIDRNASGPEGVRVIDTPDRTLMGAFDGKYIWFTSPINPNGSAINNEVVLLNTETQQFERCLTVGNFPFSIAFDGNYMWVSNIFSKTVSLMCIKSHRAIRTFGSDLFGQDFIPYSLAFDGKCVWIGSESDQKSIYKIQGFSGEPEEVTLPTEREFSVGQMIFDGAFLWVIPASVDKDDPLPKFKIDVVTNKITDLTQAFPNIAARFSMGVFDGRHLWVPAFDGVDIGFWVPPSMPTPPLTGATSSTPREDTQVVLMKIDVATNVCTGSIPVSPLFPLSGVFDGTHLWYGMLRLVEKNVIVRKVLIG